MNGRLFRLEEALSVLDTISQSAILTKYPCVSVCSFSKDFNASSVGYTISATNRERSDPSMICRISISDLYHNVDNDGFVRNTDMVMAVKHVFHEAEHLRQVRILYQNKNLSGLELDMARMDSIGVLFGGYYKSLYRIMPSEIFGDIKGFENAADWFDDNIREIDARACFVATAKEQGAWRGGRPLGSYGAMIERLHDMLDLYPKYARNHVLDETDKNTILLIREQCPSWFSRIREIEKESSVGNLDPILADKELFSAVLDIGSLWIDRHAGLDEEVKRVRQQFPSKLSAPGKVIAGIAKGINRLDENTVSTAGAAERVLAEAARMEERGGQTAGLSL